GGRSKHMTLRMNEVLRQHFDQLDVLHARQKSRVLVAREPVRAAGATPARDIHTESGIQLHEAPGVFAGGRLDIGARALLDVLERAAPRATSAVDLGCGSGILALALARDRPNVTVFATDV